MSLKHKDLKNCVSRDISIDEYEPKSGHSNEIIVVGFHTSDDAPAEDLGHFLSTGELGLIDVDVSPNPDETGSYVVFCEFQREEDFFDKFNSLVHDVQNVAGEKKWRVSPYLTDDYHDIADPTWKKFVIVNPDEYVSKKDFTPPELDADDAEVEVKKESLDKFFNNTQLNVVSVNGKDLVLETDHRKIRANISGYGEFDRIKRKHENKILESGVNFNSTTEIKALERSLPMEYETLNLNSCFAIYNEKNKDMLILTDIEYG